MCGIISSHVIPCYPPPLPRAKEEAFDHFKARAEAGGPHYCILRPGALFKEFEGMLREHITSSKRFTLVGEWAHSVAGGDAVRGLSAAAGGCGTVGRGLSARRACSRISWPEEACCNLYVQLALSCRTHVAHPNAPAKAC